MISQYYNNSNIVIHVVRYISYHPELYNPGYMYHCLTLHNIRLASKALTLLSIYNNSSIHWLSSKEQVTVHGQAARNPRRHKWCQDTR